LTCDRYAGVSIEPELKVLAGCCVLGLGDPAGARILGGESSGEIQLLAEAIAKARRASGRPVIAKVDRVEKRATQVTDSVGAVSEKLTRASTLISEFATGRIAPENLVAPANELLGLLRKLDRDGEHEDALRVARCVAVLLALLKRWADLLDSLQTALNLASRLGDTSTRAWVLHEQGTMHFAVRDYGPADRKLSEARELREQLGERHGARLTSENLQALCRALRAQLHERSGRKLVHALNRPVPTFMVAALLVIAGGVAALLIHGHSRTPRLLASHTAEIVIGVTPHSPRMGAPVAFRARVVGGEGVRYEWRFGDGEDSRAIAPTHVYRRAGAYEATVTVSNARGAILGQGIRAVHVRSEASSVEPPSPRASFGVSPVSPVVGQDVSFDASSSSDPDRSASIVSYVWKFSDGTTQQGRRPVHRYARPGTYTVELVIADTRQASASTTRQVVVTASRSSKGGSSPRPSTPTGVSASAGDRRATVTWTAPSQDGGAAITSYTVTPYVGGEAKTPTKTSGVTSVTVGSLSNGTTYTFTVAAANSKGKGPPSRHSNPVMPSSAAPQPTAPSAPSRVSATAGDRQVTVNWSAPASGGSAIISYTVTPYVGGGAMKPVAVSRGTSATVEGLSNGTAYTFTVSATSAIGTGKPSERSAPVTPAGAPSAPSKVRASGSEEAARVSWSAPANEGSAITRYLITPYANGSAQPSAQAPAGASTITIHHLRPETSYTFAVAAANGIGEGPASEHSNEVTIQYE
jgi:PKD repeat protein